MLLPHALRALQKGGGPNIEYVGGVAFSGASGSLTSLSGGLASSPSSNDIIVVTTGFRATSDLNPGVSTAGYTELLELYSNDDNDANMAVAYKVSDGTETTISVTTGPTTVVTAIQVWRGVNTSTIFDVSSTTATGTNTGNFNAPAITPVSTGAVVLICGLGTDGGFGGTYSVSGTSNPVGVRVSSAASVGMFSFAWTSGTYDPPTATGGATGAANSWCAATLALKPA